MFLGAMTCNAQMRAFVSPITRIMAYNSSNQTVIANAVELDSLAILWDIGRSTFYVRELDKSYKWDSCKATSIGDLSATRFYCDNGISFVYAQKVIRGKIEKIHLILEEAFEDGHVLTISGEWEEIAVDSGD